MARRGGFLLEASVSADYCLVSQKLFRPLQSPPTLDSLYPCSVLNFCKLLNNSKLRNHPDLAVFSVKNHPSWKSKEVCTHSYILSIRRKFKTFLSYHSNLIRSVYFLQNPNLFLWQQRQKKKDTIMSKLLKRDT